VLLHTIYLKLAQDHMLIPTILEIYGPPVNAVNDSNETEERDVGRVFYVTTDQFGNFSVGPYFRVDQGTGTVTFAASIALSNLDGIGFKRGVPVSEFSTDSDLLTTPLTQYQLKMPLVSISNVD
jgi:hypothetical protein